MTNGDLFITPGYPAYLPWMTEEQKENNYWRGALCALVNLGVPMNLKGFDYLLTAISLTASDPSYIDDVTGRLYADVAAIMEVKPANVEKCMRNAVETLFNDPDVKRLHGFFGDTVSEKSGKVTNSVFIGRIADDVRKDVTSASLNGIRKRILDGLGIKSEISDNALE